MTKKGTIVMTDASIRRAIALLGDVPKDVQVAVSRSVNRSMTASRQEAVRLTRERYTAKAGTIRKSMTLKKASWSNRGAAKVSTAQLISKSDTLSLTEFSHTPTKPLATRRKPIRVAVLKGTKKAIKGSFIARGKSGKLGVFTRRGKDRLPIEQKAGPSVPQMIGNKEVFDKMEDRAAEIMTARLDHEVNYILSKRGAK